MNTSQLIAQTPSGPVDVGEWVLDRLRVYDQVPPEDLQLTAPLTELGLDSIYVMTLCGDIEDTFELEVDPTWIAEFETLGAFVEGLVAKIESS